MNRRWSAWVPAAIWAAVLFFVSHQPTVAVDLSGGLDKVAHFGAYLVLGLLLARGPAHGSTLLIAVALGCLYGVVDEVHQSFVPGRSADVMDWVADAAGTATGVLLFMLVRRLRAGWDDDLAAPGAESTST